MKPRLHEFPFKKPVENTPNIKIHCGLCKEGKHPDGVPGFKESVLEDIEKGGFRYQYWKYYTKKRK